MNQNTAGRGPNLGLLLLVPAAVIVAKAAMHRRAMFQSGWGPSEAGGRGYGPGRRFGPGRGVEGGDPTAFRLPPKIEGLLAAWHTRAHETAPRTAPEDAIGPDDAVTA
jgi:hypothetical protein